MSPLRGDFDLTALPVGSAMQELDMPNIKPVSDLRNYAEVLRGIGSGSPVYLTKNGRGRYVIQDMEDYEKKEAAIKLMSELEKGRISGDKEGWHSLDDVRKDFGL